MATYETGNPTFLFYDGVQSSRAALRLPYAAYRRDLLGKLYAVTERLVAEHHGRQCGEPHGDDCLAVFTSVHDAIACAVELQKQTREIVLPDPQGGPDWHFSIRLTVHTAVQQVQPDDKGGYQNHPEIIYIARVLPLADAGQILLTANTVKAAGNLQWKTKPHANRRLKSFEETPQTFYELLYDGVERKEPGALFFPDWFRETNRYISRPALEEKVAQLFTERTTNGLPYRLVTLHGFGGMGKTRLALQCAIQAAGIFEDRVYIARLGDLTSDALLIDDNARLNYLYAALIKAFAIPESSVPTPEDLPAYLPVLLKAHPRTGPALLLLDNWETVRCNPAAWKIEEILENCLELRVLATGREALNSDLERGWDLEGLMPDEARDLLETRVREKMRKEWSLADEDPQAITELLDLTACIPLALELVAAHSREKTLAKIAMELHADPLGRMASIPANMPPGRKTDRHNSLERCLHWSWTLLTPEARTALICLSLFADRCPLQEITECFPALEEEALRMAAEASLAIWAREEETYSLLRPTREFARVRLKETDTDTALQKQFVAFYRQIAEQNGGSDNIEDANKRNRLSVAWPHIKNAVEIAAELKDGESCGELVNWSNHFLYRQVLWVEAVPVFLHAIEVQKLTQSDTNPSIATSLNNLAELYKSQGHYAEAEPLLKQALEIRQIALPQGHPDIAQSLNNLAGMYKSQGHYAEAEPLLKQALEIRQTALPQGHPDIAISLNNLAELYKSQGHYAEAEPLLKQALEIRQTALPQGHPDIASSLNNLALLYKSQGRYAEAEPLFKQALEIKRAALPTGHPSIATSLNNLAFLYDSQGRYAEAEPLYQQALEIRQTALPEGHPDIATSLNNLAGLYESQGRYVEAEPLYKQAVAIAVKVLGEDHPNTKTIQANYRWCMEQMT